MTAKKAGEVTERVVLKRVETAGGGGESFAWKEVGTVNAASKAAAIKQVAGDEPGHYRAPSLRSWKGGLEVHLPEKPKPERRLFE